MIKTILVPIDFSVYSQSAIKYACQLAVKHNSRLILVHAMQIQYTSAYVPVKMIMDEIEKKQVETTTQMKTMFAGIKGSNKIKAEYICKEDLVIDLVLRTGKEKNVDLIVMGTRGGSVLKNALFGSNTVKVMEHSNCPVIVIPQTLNKAILNKVIFAVDYNKQNINELGEVIKLVSPFRSEIVALHLTEEKSIGKKEEKKMADFEKAVKNKVTYKKLSFVLIATNNIAGRLFDYTESSEADLLVMSTHHRTLIEKLFNQSITKKLAYQVKLPLMVFHH